MNPEAGPVAFAVFDRLGRLLMALEGAQPAFLRRDDGDGFFFHGRRQFDRFFRQRRQGLDILGAGDFGAALAQLGLEPELGVDRLDLFRSTAFGFQLVGAQQFAQVLAFLGQVGMFAADFHFLQLAQGRAAAC